MFDPTMLQDPLLMALLQSMMQGGSNGATGLDAGGTFGNQQSNPNIFQDPSGVWKNNPPANPLPMAMPFPLPGDTATQDFIARTDQENKMKAAFAMQQAQQEGELKKIAFTKQLELANSQATSESNRLLELDKAYLSGIRDIMKPGEMTDPKIQQALADSFTTRYKLLRDNPRSEGTPQQTAKNVIEKYRQTKKDDEIRSILAVEVAKNPTDPRSQQVLDLALQYLDSTAKQAGSPAVPPAPSAAAAPKTATPKSPAAAPTQPSRNSKVLSPEEVRVAQELKNNLQNIIPSLKDTGQRGLEGAKEGFKRDLSTLGWTLDKISAFLDEVFGGAVFGGTP